MNDPFAAQLRQHLLVSADERPADGQLASVIDGVAATSQRNPLAARLAWDLGRIGPIPTTAIRFVLIAAALAIAAVAGATLAGGSPPPSSVFEGTWITIDPVDGSGMTLVVGPGERPDIYFEDGYATGAACVNDAVKRFTARGTGAISDDGLVLEATFPEGGGCGLTTVEVHGIYHYDGRADTLADQDGVVWSRALGQGPEPRATEMPAPITSPEAHAPSPSTPPSSATFVSTMNGISIDYPEGWRTRSATEPFTGMTLDFDTPGADVIFDPALGDGLYLAVASHPYGSLAPDDWWAQSSEWLCPEGVDGAGGGWGVDGADTTSVRCGSTKTFLVMTETRGYLIRLVVPSSEPALAEIYDQDWLLSVLGTVDLRPEEAVDAPLASTPMPDPDCIQFDAPGTYIAPAGHVTLGVTVPATSDQTWHGHPDSFFLTRSPCLLGGPWLDASAIRQVYADACERTGTGVDVESPTAAVAALTLQQGVIVDGTTSVTVDGRAGTRFDVVIPDDVDPATCTDGVVQLFDWVANDLPATVVVVDVDGVALGLVFHGFEDDDAASDRILAAEIDEILASMQIDP